MENLITGGAGFIGSHLSEKLLARGQRVTVIDDLSTGELANVSNFQENTNFELEVGSVLDRDRIRDLVNRADRVFHLAAAVGVKYIVENPLKSMEINIDGTKNILEACNRQKTPVFLASTSEIYGKNEDIPFREDQDRHLGSTHISRWSYSATKAVDEFLARAFYRTRDVPVVIGRFFNTVGPRQTGKYGMVIPTFVRQALLGHPITVHGDGQQSRAFLDVDDATEAVLALVEKEEALGEAFNIGSRERVTIEELALKIKDYTNSNSTVQYIPYEEAYEQGFEDMRHRVPDTSKLTQTINFKQTYDLDSTLKRIIDYFRFNGEFD